MKTFYKILIALMLASGSASADYIKGEQVACLTEKLYDEIIEAAARHDKKGFEYYLKNGCFITRYGLDVVILDTTWTGKAKVRTYVGDDAVVFWTNINNIKRGK